MHASYPNLRALTQFHELKTPARTIAVHDQCEVIGLFLPVEPLLAGVGVLRC